MAIITTLAACNVNPALNGPDGAVDLPSTLDDAIRYLCSFVAQLRDGAGMPLGSIICMPTLTAPTGFVKLNGALLSRATYANLFAFASGIGLVSEATWNGGQFGSFSVGDGSTTFRIPDLRAMFLRGLDESRGIDSGRVLGVWQDQLLLSHAHTITDPSHAHGGGDAGHGHTGGTDVQGNHAHTSNYPAFTGITAAAGSFGNLTSGGATGAGTSADGAHSHNVSINTGYANIVVYGAYTGINGTNAAGGAENRVKNLAFPFYMRY